MKIILEQEAPQRSDAWHRLHIGRPTASEFHRVVTPKKMQYAAAAAEYSYRLAAERLLNRSFQKSLEGLRYIEEGKEEEPKAVQQYETLHEVETYKVSMILTDDGRFGCSPDRLVVDDDRHGLEIKSLFPPHLIKHHMEGSGDEHKIQVLGQLWIGELHTNDLYCYNQWCPPYFWQWKRRDYQTEIDIVAGHLDRFGDKLDAMVEELRGKGFFTATAAPVTMLDEIAETMIAEAMKRETIEELDTWWGSDLTAANLEPLDREQRERIEGMVNHKRAHLKTDTRDRIVVGWQSSSTNAADLIVKTGNWGG